MGHRPVVDALLRGVLEVTPLWRQAQQSRCRGHRPVVDALYTSRERMENRGPKGGEHRGPPTWFLVG